ncbi:flagellar hook-length control protein FliK [Massilia horti]|uniref:Flagellar hook-length control protein FliK n=2 Tax=Massilia horti TaxID=2562153 RepID=A0A4Y9SSL3_9BURK|nr:flagellar hook-length control protein FliK [Massilia horti]
MSAAAPAKPVDQAALAPVALADLAPAHLPAASLPSTPVDDSATVPAPSAKAGPAPASFAAAEPAAKDASAAAPVTSPIANTGAPQAQHLTAAAPLPPVADTVALPGPPTAWRAPLHQALGERLQLQVGSGIEQAVIRLDPPNLGRVEIAIRHASGSLEVTLTATHNEVLRELRTVSEALRGDLAQRQYLDVAVTVAPAPRQAAAGAFAGEQHGRGRQGGHEQDDSQPGLALAEADGAASAFSLNGRE